MRIDVYRITKYLQDIQENTLKIEEILKSHTLEDLLKDELPRLALKFLVIEIAEAMANILQHLLAKAFGVAVKGYIDTVSKAADKNILSNDLFRKIKPFFDFRNALIHRYWTIEDPVFLQNLTTGYRDFLQFCDEIERWIQSRPSGRGPTRT